MVIIVRGFVTDDPLNEVYAFAAIANSYLGRQSSDSNPLRYISIQKHALLSTTCAMVSIDLVMHSAENYVVPCCADFSMYIHLHHIANAGPIKHNLAGSVKALRKPWRDQNTISAVHKEH